MLRCLVVGDKPVKLGYNMELEGEELSQRKRGIRLGFPLEGQTE